MTVMLSLAMTPLLLLNFSSWFIACYFILLNCVSVHILQRLTSPPPLLHRLWRQDREDMGRRLPSTARRAERPHEQGDFSCVRREREVLGVRWCGRGLKRVGTCFPAISRMLCRCCDAFKAQCCDWWWRWCYGDVELLFTYWVVVMAMKWVCHWWFYNFFVWYAMSFLFEICNEMFSM